MLKNYIKVAWRNFLNNKFYSAINVIGLAVGLAVGILILLWIQDELSFDSFNKQAKNIYKVDIIGGTGASRQILNSIIAPVAPFAKNEIPEVKDAVRIKRAALPIVEYNGKKFVEDKMAFTDPSFFTVFDFPLIQGNAQQPFPDMNSIVVTESIARKYFGNADPIGKVLVTGDNGNKINLKVSGVIKDFPANSSINYNLLVPVQLFNYLAYVKGHVEYNGAPHLKSIDEDWVNFSYEVYLLLKPNVSAKLIEKKLQQIHERVRPIDAPVPYLMQPLLKMHLYKADGGDAGIETVRIFAIVTALILIIACINYVNLATARSMLRAKEVSMRKIIGAAKTQLFLQFIIETALLFLMAVVVAIVGIYLLMPVYNSFSGKQLSLHLANYHIWLSIALTLIGTLAASSIYPALLLSSFEPLKALKGRVAAGVSNASFRRALVVVQFSVSIILIIGTLVISNQLHYISSKRLGYDKEHVFSFAMSNGLDKHYDAIKAELLKQPEVAGVTRANVNIVDFDNWTGDLDWDGKPTNSNILLHPVLCDQTFIPFFKIKLTKGNNFSGSITDSTHFILNEAAVHEMGLKDPIGKRLRIWKTNGTIIRVAKDFHFTSMRKKIEPAVFVYDPKGVWQLYVKTTAAGAPQAIAASNRIWKAYNQDLTFNYSFLDDTFNRLYQSEQRTGALFNGFAGIAIMISCLGLLGLATYTAQVKTKEIGIRKVLGASIGSIVQLLASEFVLLIIVAILIAIPVAWYTMNKWLMDFAYRISISWWVFLLAGCGAIFIALATISLQSVKAALANPVKSLRNE